MKKILVLSDSHGHFEKVLKIYEKEKPDILVYAGDGLRDIENLSCIYEGEFYLVNGNCDFFEKNYGLLKVLEIEKFKIFITHGHAYQVKNDLEKLKEETRKLKADIVIFGHTHREILEKYESFYLFNPGACQDGKYGFIIINEGRIDFYHRKI
ncbi:MAG: metallophosphoesterase [Fusobacterium sp.]|uniref:metallophosphoesterase family protein n=1 Tax=Fusobacterium sp. TaxID=68766 RepID=UPI0026DBABB7|nr:metallophosphoesterase [Fusobacterium sp.]MDO4690086.1 metallophosphoesterase [Fusobacterium sp.]